MARTLGRRAIFFAVTSLICLFLVPATPSEFRWVAWFSAALGGFWAIAMSLEDLSMPGQPKASPPGSVPPTPFEPPPPPGAAR